MANDRDGSINRAMIVARDSVRRAEGGTVAPQRQLTPLGFYSQGAEAAQALPQAKGSPGQMKAMLLKSGVKPTEIENANYDQTFGSQPSVNKATLASHFQNSLPDVQKSSDEKNDYNNYKDYTLKGGNNYREVLLHLPEVKPSYEQMKREREQISEAEKIRGHLYDLNTKQYEEKSAEINRIHQESIKPFRTEHRNDNKKIGENSDPNYTIEQRGRDYKINDRNLLDNVAPFDDARQEASIKNYNEREKTDKQIARDHEKKLKEIYNMNPIKNFKTNHFETPNILAHLRYKDRKNDEGQDLLHIEELQSDWGQKGRQEGFHPAGELPNAPYVNNTSNWVDFGLKHALMEAAKGGYDKLSWSPGEIHADIYGLQKHLEGLRFIDQIPGGIEKPDMETPTTTGSLHVLKKGGNIYEKIEHNIGPDRLKELIGEELSKKLLDAKQETGTSAWSGHRIRSLEGVDLKIGGEGMKSFYDKIVPNQLQKLASKLDPEAKVALNSETIKDHLNYISKSHDANHIAAPYLLIRQDSPGSFVKHIISSHKSLDEALAESKLYDKTLHSLAITPLMRANILKGLPAFAEGGAVAPQRQLTPLGFYSQGAEAAQALPQAKGSPGQMKAMLLKSGVKPTEIENANYDQTFGSQPSVNKATLASHFQNSLPDVQKSSYEDNNYNNYKDYTLKGGNNYREVLLHLPTRGYDVLLKSLLESKREIKEDYERQHAPILAEYDRQRAPIQAEYERQLKKIGKENDRQFAPILAEYERQHAPILAELKRGNYQFRAEYERQRAPILAEYERQRTPIHAEYERQRAPIQAEYERQHAPIQAEYDRQHAPIQAEYERQHAPIQAEYERIDDLLKKEAPINKDFKTNHFETPNILAHLRYKDRTNDEGQKLLHIEELQSDWGQKGRKKGFHPEGELPNAPYVKNTSNWVDFGLKHALMEVAKGGYDKLSWSPGEIHADIYGLQKHFKGLRFIDQETGGIEKPDMETPTTTGSLHALRENNIFYQEIEHDINQERLKELIGNELSNKLIAAKQEIGASNGMKHRVRSLEGIDLKMGGEGMKSFYDKIVPNQLQKLASKLDPEAKVALNSENVEGKAIHSLAITPLMRANILKGLPAFSKGGSIT